MYLILKYLCGDTIRYKLNPKKDKLYVLDCDVYLSHMDGEHGESIYLAHGRGNDEEWVKSEIDSANKAAIFDSNKTITVLYDEGSAQEQFEEFMLEHGEPHFYDGTE